METKHREIKFRAWYEKSQTWVYFDLNKGFASELALDVYRDLLLNGTRFFEFTGLHDKNRNDIYEGDIVKCIDHPTWIENVTGEVIFDRGRYWVSTQSICSLDDYGTAWTEIIGNIFENPELLTP